MPHMLESMVWSFIQNKLNLSQLIHDRIYCFVLAQVFIPCLIHFKSEYFRVGKGVIFIICECFMKKGVSKLVNFKMYLVEFIYTGSCPFLLMIGDILFSTIFLSLEKVTKDHENILQNVLIFDFFNVTLARKEPNTS